ncbi:carbohydrate kinase, FGGY family [Mycobacterium xenopi 4042]|uniref:glycerol kinase n=1 Tax=Mycobacterium xenopi 4042 TaxID=1299334 RepID=X8EEI3_MYCXE|nr:carbohydrate kinase, FGGY family [Mycobacterium xenopi 4042]
MIRRKAGLPPATYFSAGKLQWILDNVDGVRDAAEHGDAIFGTCDTWVLWNLTGGPRGGVHLTDVTNASRTMLMDLQTLDWDDELLSFFGIPRAMLPSIASSAPTQPFGVTHSSGPLGGEVPVTGILGDQHAAMVGQVCLDAGEAKNTYGTGNFLLLNTGEKIVRSQHGLLTTVCYQFGNAKPVYALEGSIAVTGSAVQWLRDQLGIISGAAQSETLARQVDDNGGVYFVPAFSGLFAPYWRSDARGVIVGLSRFNTNAHLARATLEAICYQSRDVVDAMAADSGVRLELLKVDGGITANELCMQIQADVLGVDVVRPVVAETTALGAAYAAGLAVGFWADPDDLRPTGGRTSGGARPGRRRARRGVCGLAQGGAAQSELGRGVVTASARRRRRSGVFAEHGVDLPARIVHDGGDALLLFGAGRVHGLRDSAEQLTQRGPQVEVAGSTPSAISSHGGSRSFRRRPSRRRSTRKAVCCLQFQSRRSDLRRPVAAGSDKPTQGWPPQAPLRSAISWIIS